MHTCKYMCACAYVDIYIYPLNLNLKLTSQILFLGSQKVLIYKHIRFLP